MAINPQNDYFMPVIADNAYLRIRTSKIRGYLQSIASVYLREGAFETHRVHHDYYQPIQSKDGRSTQKNLDTLHASSLESLVQIKELALEHYENVERK